MAPGLREVGQAVLNPPPEGGIPFPGIPGCGVGSVLLLVIASEEVYFKVLLVSSWCGLNKAPIFLAGPSPAGLGAGMRVVFFVLLLFFLGRNFFMFPN